MVERTTFPYTCKWSLVTFLSYTYGNICLENKHRSYWFFQWFATVIRCARLQSVFHVSLSFGHRSFRYLVNLVAHSLKFSTAWRALHYSPLFVGFIELSLACAFNWADESFVTLAIYVCICKRVHHTENWTFFVLGHSILTIMGQFHGLIRMMLNFVGHHNKKVFIFKRRRTKNMNTNIFCGLSFFFEPNFQQ